MATSSSPQSPWWLECIQCKRRVMNASELRLAHVGLDGFHLAVRPELESQIDMIIEKRQHPKPARRKEAPFKMYCHGAGCSNDLGVYQLLEERFFYVFSSKSVRFRSVRGEEKKIKRWKLGKSELEAMGVRVLEVKAIWQTISREAGNGKKAENHSKEMVYCNVESTSEEQVNKLVLDRPREYQKELFKQAMGGNSIVYLPTGSGKTLVATMVIGAMKKLNPDKMIAFLVHRIPLVYQQSQYIKKEIPRLRVEILAGDLTRFPGDREHWVHVIEGISQKRIDVLVITAQIFFNFLVDDDPTLRLSDVSCIVFDEAHHCKGNHVYARIMRQFYVPLENKYKPLILGLTASPAGAITIEETREQLTELLSTMQAQCIMPVLSNDLTLHWNNPLTSYELRPLSQTQENLERILAEFLKSLCPKIEELSNAKETLNRTSVSSHHFKSSLRTVIELCHSRGEYLEGLALAQHAMNLFSIIELNRVLGPSHARKAIVNTLNSIDHVRSPMDMITKRLLSSQPTYKPFRDQIRCFPNCSNVASGRFTELLTIVHQFIDQVKRDGTSRAIVFVHMRRTCFKLCEELGKDLMIKEQLNPLACVGHGSGIDGMQWKGEQEVVITRFHGGECKLLVSTNVLEEGLDVPACNLVIRYDSRGTSLRALVQSRGRAARRSDSRFVIMCNDVEELTRYKELAVKESNIERAVREKISSNIIASQASRFGCQKRSLGPETKGNEKRKTPEGDNSKISKKQRTERPPRRKPYTAITLHVTPSAKEEISEAIELLESCFDIKTFRPEGATPQDRPTIEQLNMMQRSYLEVMEATEDANENTRRRVKSRDEIFQEIARKWCQLAPKQMWLERKGKKNKIRGASVHPLFITAIGVGDFTDRTTFAEEWSYVCLPGAMGIFEHDLKNATLAFQDHPEGSIFKVEFQYKEIHDCILVDTARPGAGTCSLFIPLRSMPRVFEAEGLHGNETDAEDDLDFLNLLEQGELFSDSDDDSLGEDDDDDNDEDQNGILGNDSGNSSEQPGNESSAEPSTDVIGKMKLVTKWKRLYRITSTRHGMKVGVFGNSLVLKIVLPFNEALWDMLKTMGYYDRRVCYAAIQTIRRPLATPNSGFQILDPKVQYAFECLTSRHPAVMQRIGNSFFQKLGKTKVEKCVDALERSAVFLDENYFVDPEATLEFLLLHCKSLGRRKLVVPENCVLIPRMVFTPTRQIFFPPEVMEKNRVLRHFRESKFLCLQIRDEDFSPLAKHTGNIAEILASLKRLLSNHVLAGGTRYDFLGCSNSQLRSHSCWFVAPGIDHNADSIRRWMGDFTKIRCVATFMARMGQCFSTSTDTIAVIPEETGIEFEDIEDVTIDADDQTYTFSDGVGRISANVAKKVSSFINKPIPPSALQIRFAGYKGVLTTDPRMQDNRIHLRPSMRKFESNHRRLEVLQTSRPQAVYLNHQIIMLLSNLGVPDDVFIGHQQTMLDDLAYMMTDENEANQRLSCAIRTGINYKSLVDVGVSLTTEPYFKSLLCALYREKIHGLLSKARILLPVSEARLMMGVMDETGLLGPGQVFVQYTEMKAQGEGDDSNIVVKNRKTVVTGRVAVTRNPCLHPGDVRQLDAVDFPELRHLLDCVVFPSRGPRPNPNEMAGGDLDGDLYFVCWGKDLRPRKPDFAPMNYKSPEKKKVDGTITLNHMTDFITEYITCDQLGVIDNTHKAQADAQGTGVESPICLELAELHSLAVDAPKTGLWQDVPVSARLRQYPDFMMKSDKPSYPSQKVLGKLYRECRNFQETMNFKPPQRAGHVDPRFLIQGFDEYADSAQNTLVEYTEHIETVLNLYGIETEEELVSGCFYKLKKKLGREKQQIADVVRRLLIELRTIFRQAFFQEFQRDHTPVTAKEVTSDMQKKASAWYYVSYRSNLPKNTDQERGHSEHHLKRVIGFPWIVDDVLATIPPNNKRAPRHVPSNKNVYSAIGSSMGQLFAKTSESLINGYKERLRVKTTIFEAIQGNYRNLGLVTFGSSATLFFEEESDIDLCVLRCNTLPSGGKVEKPEQLALLKKVEPVLRQLYNGVHLVSRARIPIYRLAGLKREDSLGSKLCVDLCANPDGFFKAMVVTSYIHRYPALLPLLRVLLQWGRDSGLIRKVDGSRINTNVLVFMLLTFGVRNGWIAELGVKDIQHHVEGMVGNRVKDAELVETWEKILVTLMSDIIGDETDHASEEDVEMEDISVGQCQDCHLNLGPRNTPVGFVLFEFFRRHQSLIDDTQIPQCFVGLLGVEEFQSLLGAGDAELLHEQMQRAYHILALHCDVTILLEVCASEVQLSCHLSDQLSAWIASSERYHSKMFSEKSGAKVRIRPRLPGLGLNLLLEASGTSVALRLLENILDDKSASLISQPFSCIGLCFVTGANAMIFEGSQTDSDPVNLVPYFGLHHPPHDYLILHVPLLANPPLTTNITSPTERSFRVFLEKLLQQMEVISRDYTPVVHGETLEFNVHFGRLYTLHVPRALTEDTDPITVKSLQISLNKGFESKAASFMSLNPEASGNKLFRRPMKRRKTAKKASVNNSEEKQGKKAEKKRSPKHSFFTNLPDESIGSLTSFLQKKGFREEPNLGQPYILVTVNTDDGRECDITYDSKVHPKWIRSPKLRWFVADVKRPWCQRSTVSEQAFAPDMINGLECDYRLMVRSFKNFSPNAVEKLQHKKYLDILRPRTGAVATPTKSSCPFQINLDLKNNLGLVRHHVEQHVYAHRSRESGVAREFLSSTTVSLDEVTEYSRLKVNGTFASVFKRFEMTLQPQLPSNWTSREIMEKFAWQVWSLAFEIACEAYQ